MATRAMPATGIDGRRMSVTHSLLSMFDNGGVFATLIISYFWLCTYLYTDIIGNVASLRQSGFEAFPTSGFAKILAIGFCVFPLLWVRRNFKAPSDIIVFQLYLYVYVPTTAYLVMATPMTLTKQLGFLTMTMLALALLELRRVLRTVELDRFPLKENWFIGSLTVSSIALILLFVSVGQVTLDSLDLGTVYERRADIVGVGGRSLLVFAANWSALAIAPLTMLYGLLRRQWWILGIGLLLAVTCYAVTSFRSHLFTPIFAVMICMVLRTAGPRRSGIALLAVALSICLLPLFFDLATGGLATWVIHFRFIGNNGFLSAQYFAFFADAPKGFYQDSFGRFFVTPQYFLPIAELVGSSFSSVAGNHANGNLWADGFGNMGVIGVGFASLSVVLLCWLVDSLGRDLDRIQTSALLIPLIFAISNTSVHSALTSSGGLLVILLLFFMPQSSVRFGEH
jgi:hypothetical protein